MAIADGAYHFDVEQRALREALRFDEFPGALQLFLPPLELFIDGDDRALSLFGRHYIMRLGVDRDASQIFLPCADFSGKRIDLAQGVDLLAPHFDAIPIVFIGGVNLDHVAANAKSATAQILGTGVLNINEPAKEG